MWNWIVLGIVAGIITGLIPGIHVNLVAALVLGLSLSSGAVVFLVSLSVTHSFLDSIPSIMLGAPDGAMALGVLPGHRLLLEGRGQEAVVLTLLGSFCGLVLCALLIPLWYFLLGGYVFLQKYLFWLLLAACLWILFRERSLQGTLVFACAGVLGILVLRRDVITEPLFPLLSGLFGVSILLESLFHNSRIPPQVNSWPKLSGKEWSVSLGSGCFSGFIVSVLPGLGSAQAAAFAMSIVGRLRAESLLVLLGSINTVNFVLSLLTWAVLDKARNGAIVAASSLVESSVALSSQLLVVALFAGGVATLLGLWLARTSAQVLSKLPYRGTVVTIICLIIGLVFWRSSWQGILLLFTSTTLGVLTSLLKVPKATLMSSILVPVTVFFALV